MELKIEHLSKQFKDKTAVNDVNLTLTPGVWGLLGANGAGKTTLMRMIADIMTPTNGAVYYDGKDIRELGEVYRSKFGFLPQDFGYHRDFTVKDYLEYMAALKDIPTRATTQKINHLLDILSLSDVKKKKISNLSGGMKRRVGIAQAMLNDPEILVMDEPTAGLDPGERVRLRNFISEFSHDRIVLISTHIVSDIEYISTCNAIMKAGEIVDVGTTAELVKRIEGKVWNCIIRPQSCRNVKCGCALSISEAKITIRFLFVICPNIRKLMGLLQRSHDWKICICGCSRRQTWKRRTDNMWLFRLELKRILKSRRTLILLAIALLLSVAMAYLPISFEGINRPNEDGTVTELDGLAAIKYKQDLYKTSAGEVTPDRIKSALETYQSCVREYGPVEEEGFPLAVFIEKIVPFRHLLMGLSEAFADPLTGIGADLMDIDPNDIDGAYYEKCAEHLQDVMRNEQRENETAQQKALEKYSELDTPFYLHSGISKDAFDYIEFYILFLAILCVAIAAPTFAGEYQTGGDSILRTTKYGHKQLAITKILAAFTLFVVTFLVGITVHILILDAAFGTDCLKTSFQMRYSIINLPNINLGQLQIILAAAGLLSVLATVSCTLFLSAKCKDTLTVLLISIVVLLMPLFAYVAMGATWLSTILPSAGIGMQNNFLSQLADFNYLNIGGMSFWTPHVILISAGIELFVFTFLAIHSYCRHQVA